MLKRVNLIILIICLSLNLSACSTRNNPVIYYSNFDFSQVKTYSFYSSGSTFFDSQSLTHWQRGRIELAIEKTLNSKDFNYTELANADIILTYHLVKNKLLGYQAYNKVVKFCSHCLRASAWQQPNSQWLVYPGGLIIDLVDPKKNRSVWRSIHPLKFSEKDNSQKQNEIIREAVNAMLLQYPSDKK
ncbi:MAG: DUF4136 domain-containing protein [Colwellia sp.]|nr:DUF4136 domain-containing protein [Colwellia sp.]